MNQLELQAVRRWSFEAVLSSPLTRLEKTESGGGRENEDGNKQQLGFGLLDHK